MPGDFSMSVDASRLKEIAKACRAEADGKQLRKDLIKGLKLAAEPGKSAVVARLAAIPSTGNSGDPPLSSYLQARVKVGVRTGGRMPGVRVYVPQTPGMRNFAMAARWLDRKRWRRQVYGNAWVEQRSPIPNYFETAMRKSRPKAQAQIERVLADMANRLTARR